MTYALAQRICRFLMAHGATKAEDADAVSFGLFHILSNTLQLILLAIPALLLGCVPHIALYTAFFTSLKKNAGGAHANRHWICLSGFTALAFGTWLLCSFVPEGGLCPLSGMVALFSAGIVWMRAPVAHPDNPKSPQKLRKLRRISRQVATAQAAAILLGILALPEWSAPWLLCGAMGGLAAAFTLLLPMAGISTEQKEEGG